MIYAGEEFNIDGIKGSISHLFIKGERTYLITSGKNHEETVRTGITVS